MIQRRRMTEFSERVYFKSKQEDDKVKMVARTTGNTVSGFIRDCVIATLRQFDQHVEMERKKEDYNIPIEFKEVDVIGPPPTVHEQPKQAGDLLNEILGKDEHPDDFDFGEDSGI